MPDGVKELNYNFWTSMSRRGCVGEIKKCLQKQNTEPDKYPEYNAYFWRAFDRTDSGACVAIQSLPYGTDNTFNVAVKDLSRYPAGPVLVNCMTLNYFACEVEGRRSQIIDETEIMVSTNKK